MIRLSTFRGRTATSQRVFSPAVGQGQKHQHQQRVSAVATHFTKTEFQRPYSTGSRVRKTLLKREKPESEPVQEESSFPSSSKASAITNKSANGKIPDYTELTREIPNLLNIYKGQGASAEELRTFLSDFDLTMTLTHEGPKALEEKLKQREKEGVKPSIETYLIKLTAVSTYEEALEIVKQMKAAEVDLTSDVYNTLIWLSPSALKAEEHYRELVEQGWYPTKETFESLLNVLRDFGEDKKFLDYWAEMERHNIKPDAEILELLDKGQPLSYEKEKLRIQLEHSEGTSFSALGDQLAMNTIGILDLYSSSLPELEPDPLKREKATSLLQQLQTNPLVTVEDVVLEHYGFERKADAAMKHLTGVIPSQLDMPAMLTRPGAPPIHDAKADPVKVKSIRTKRFKGAANVVKKKEPKTKTE